MWMSSGVGVCLTVLGLCVSVCVCVCVAVGAHLVELVGNQHARGQPARRSGAASYEHGHMGQHGWEPSTREARGARGPARESWVADQHVRASTSRVSYRETLLIEIIQSSRASAWMCACEHHALMGFIFENETVTKLWTLGSSWLKRMTLTSLRASTSALVCRLRKGVRYTLYGVACVPTYDTRATPRL